MFSTFSRRVLAAAALLAVIGASSGCQKQPPEITPVSGVVTLGGYPVPHAFVQFVPQLDEFGAEFNSSATTDEMGKFTLICDMGAQPGAAVCEHRVLVMEAPASEEFRGMDGESQAKYAAYLGSLRNRPIPLQYGSVLNTPLRVQVSKDKQEYELQLTR